MYIMDSKDTLTTQNNRLRIHMKKYDYISNGPKAPRSKDSIKFFQNK